MVVLKLQSSDGDIITVDSKVMRCSVLIKTMLENLGFGDGNESIPLPNVDSETLKKVLEWADHHKDDDPVLEADETKEKRTDDIVAWDVDFLSKVDQGTLFELILAANYLDIKGLLDATCKTVANMIQGKTSEEIRKTFNIKNDFSPAEMAQIAKENAWCEDKFY